MFKVDVDEAEVKVSVWIEHITDNIVYLTVGCDTKHPCITHNNNEIDIYEDDASPPNSNHTSIKFHLPDHWRIESVTPYRYYLSVFIIKTRVLDNEEALAWRPVYLYKKDKE